MTINKRRLRKLADFLENEVKEKWFDMRVIADQGFDVQECGTAACCLGWTPSVFPRSGVELVRNSNDPDYYELELRYESLEGFAAGALFYSLTEDETEYLFEPSQYPYVNGERSLTRRVVVKRIRDFCDGTMAVTI